MFHPEPGKEPPYRVPSLSFVISFGDGSGTFDAKFAILDPDGEEILPEQNLNPSTLRVGVNGAIVVNLHGGVQFTKFGEYTVRLKLERKTYEYPFDVAVGDPVRRS